MVTGLIIKNVDNNLILKAYFIEISPQIRGPNIDKIMCNIRVTVSKSEPGQTDDVAAPSHPARHPSRELCRMIRVDRKHPCHNTKKV